MADCLASYLRKYLKAANQLANEVPVTHTREKQRTMPNQETKHLTKKYHATTRFFAGLGFLIGMLISGYALVDTILSDANIIKTLGRTFTLLIMFYFTWCFFYIAKTGQKPLKTMPFSINEKSQL